MEGSGLGAIKGSDPETCRRRLFRCVSFSRVPPRREDKRWTGRGFFFSLFSGVLVWFAFSAIGLVKAQEPAKPDMPAAGKDAPAAKDAGGSAHRSKARRLGYIERPPWLGATQCYNPPVARTCCSGPSGHPGPTRRVFAVAFLIYFTALVIRLFMEFRVTGGGAGGPGRQARNRDPAQEISGCLRRLQGQRQLPGPVENSGNANRCPNRRADAKEAMQQGNGRDGDDPRNEDQLPGDHRDLGAHDRPGGQHLGHDPGASRRSPHIAMPSHAQEKVR